MDRDGEWYAYRVKPGGWSLVGRCWSTSRVRCDTLMTPDRIAIQVRSSGYGQAAISSSSGEGLNTGHHEKAAVRCPYNRLATLHGAPRMHVVDVVVSSSHQSPS